MWNPMRVGFQVFWRDEELDLLRQSGVYEQTLHRKLLLKSQFETIQPVMIPTAENENCQSCGIIYQLQVDFMAFDCYCHLLNLRCGYL